MDSLATVESSVLNEGVKFIFAQLTDLLRRLRERREQKHGASPPAPTDLVVAAQSPEALDGALTPSTVSVGELTRLEPQMRELRQQLADYADGIESADNQDVEFLALFDEARSLLEIVLGQRITFRGEQASASGTTIDAKVRASEIEGYLAGIRVRRVSPGTQVTARVEADVVRPGGSVIGVDAESL